MEWVLRMTSRYREPETTRHAHRLVNEVRREALAARATSGE